MKDLDSIRNFDSSMKSALLNCYEMSGEASAQWDDEESSILMELAAIKHNFADKRIHSTGGMKRVACVRELKTDRLIAMAELKDPDNCTQADVERFLREARITAALEHPNIVPVYEIGLNAAGMPFFTMKFLKDQSLSKVVRELVKCNPFYVDKYSRNSLINIFLKVCEAVSYAHSCHVAHLDLKPSNIMVGDYGEVYVCDWGLAKLLFADDGEEVFATSSLDPDLLNDITLTGVIKGTLCYMAPEQIDKTLGLRNEKTDIYALGAILYKLLTFCKPFHGMSTEEILSRTLCGELPEPKALRNDIPDGLNAIVRKAMSVKQNDRYETVQDLIHDVHAHQEGFATEAENATSFKTLGLFLKRHAKIGAITVLAAMVVFGMMVKIKLNEQQLLEALQLYSREKENKEQKIIAAAPLQIDNWSANLGSLDLGWVEEQVMEILRIDPSNRKALGLKAVILFFQGKFLDSYNVFFSLPAKDTNTVKRMCKAVYDGKIRTGYLTVADACNVITIDHFHKERPMLASLFWRNVFKQLPTIAEKEELVARIIGLNDRVDSLSLVIDNRRFSAQVRSRGLVGVVDAAHIPNSRIKAVVPVNQNMEDEVIKGYALRVDTPSTYTVAEDRVHKTLDKAGVYFSFSKPIRMLKGLSFNFQKISSNFYYLAVQYSVNGGQSWIDFPRSPIRHFITNKKTKVHEFDFTGELENVDMFRILPYGHINNFQLSILVDNLKVEFVDFEGEIVSELEQFRPVQVEITGKEGNWELDLSANPNLVDISGLESLPIYSLDLKNTAIENINMGSNPDLREINLSGCRQLNNILSLQNLPQLRRLMIPDFKRNSPIVNKLQKKQVELSFDLPLPEEQE